MSDQMAMENYHLDTDPWLWPDSLRQNVESEQLDLIADSIMEIEVEYQDLLKRLEMEKEKAKHFSEMKKLKRKYDENLKQQIKDAEDELEKLDKEIVLIELGKTPELMQLDADIAFMQRVVAQNQALLDQYTEEYNEFPMVKEIERLKNETLKLRVDRWLKEYRKESQDRMNKMYLDICKQREQNAIIELAKAWKVHMEKIKRNAEADRINAQLEREVEELREMKRMRDARKAEEKRQEMLARSLMPPPAAKIRAKVKKTIDDDCDKQSVFSLMLDNMISSDSAASVEDFEVERVTLEKSFAASPKIPSSPRFTEKQSVHSPIMDNTVSFSSNSSTEDSEGKTMEIEESVIPKLQTLSNVAETNDCSNVEMENSFCKCNSDVSNIAISSTPFPTEMVNSASKKKPKIQKVEEVSYSLPKTISQSTEVFNMELTDKTKECQMENKEAQHETSVFMHEVGIKDDLLADLEKIKSNESSLSNTSNTTLMLSRFSTNPPTEASILRKPSIMEEEFDQDQSCQLDITPAHSNDGMSFSSSLEILPGVAISRAGNQPQQQPQVSSNEREQMELGNSSPKFGFFAF